MKGPNRISPRKVAALLATLCVLAGAAYAAETPLTNGVPLTGLSGAIASETFYKIEVPAGQDDLEILTTGGSGDVDLYVRRGALPTTTSWDYRPYKPGNEETVAVDNPTAGTWYIMLRGYAAYASVTLKATYSAAVTITNLTSGVPVTGLTAAAGGELYFKIDVPASQLKLDIAISGGTGDADLYVRKDAMPTTALYDYRPYQIGSEESVTVNNPVATSWYIMVRGYASFSGLSLVATYTGGVGEELQNGVAVTSISGTQNSERIFRIEVPASQTNLDIASWGGTGDADLYVKFGSRPTTTSYDYRPYLAGTDESVSINTPTAGTWYIMLRGYSDFSGASLKASYGDMSTLQNGVAVTGLLGSLNSEKFYKMEVPSGQETLSFVTSGGTGNVDVYIKRGAKPSTSTYDYRLVQAGNAENISIGSPTGGTWYIMLKATAAYSGVSLEGEYSFSGTVTLLTNGVPVTGISGAEGSERIYRLIVPGSQATLAIQISGGTGDADLYVKRGSPPTALEYDYRPYLIGSEESVTVTNPASGDWFIMIRGYRAYAGLTLVATYGGGGGPEEVVTLTNGVAVTGISGAAESAKYYKIDVPAGQAKLEIIQSDGTGDADLYVKKGAKPTVTDYDARPYLLGNNETVSIDNPDAATWYIMVRGYGAYSGVSLKATYYPVAETVTALTNGVPVTGLAGATGSEKFYKIDVPSGQDFLNIETAGGTGDVDLYVKKGAKPTTASFDYRPYLIGNAEKVEITNPAAATWYIMLRGYEAYAGVTLTGTYGVTAVGNNFAVDPNCAALWRFEPTKLTLDSIRTNKLADVNTVDVNTVDYKEGTASASIERDHGEYFSIVDANLSSGFPFKNGTTNSYISTCFWMNLESLPPWPYLLSKNVSGKSGFAISVNSVHKLRLGIGYDNGLSTEFLVHDSVIETGRWYHVGITFNNTSKAYRIRIWDATAGAILGTDKTGTAVHNVTVDAGEVRIGHIAGFSRIGYNFDGLLDEFVVFNDILSSGEIDKVRLGTYGKP